MTPKPTDTAAILGGVFDPSELLTPEQTARLLNVRPRTLETWRGRGGGPAFVKVSKRCVRYRRRDLEAWAAERVRRNTIETAKAA